ncbi:MAG: hypothetical protein F6K00_23195 [Leptolyngbya sp. SIOISBB]|nr:hypothetical protein [Leptolyngbya sp. SIOISBB]
MALQKFSLEVVQKVQQYIQLQLTLPDSEQQPVSDSQERAIAVEAFAPESLDALGDLFRVGGFGDDEGVAPNAEGRWFISTIDPAAALAKLPGLDLKNKVRLITYLQRQSTGGMGVTWALPELMSTTAELEAAIESAGEGAIPPHPKGALGNVMEGVTGDRSAASYLSASILLREFKEFGRSGHNCRWRHHRLITASPNKPWQWRTPKPLANLAPKVQIKDDKMVAVEFFSCRVVPPVAIFRHLDQYVAKSYRPKTNDQVVALLP